MELGLALVFVLVNESLTSEFKPHKGLRQSTSSISFYYQTIWSNETSRI